MSYLSRPACEYPAAVAEVRWVENVFADCARSYGQYACANAFPGPHPIHLRHLPTPVYSLVCGLPRNAQLTCMEYLCYGHHCLSEVVGVAWAPSFFVAWVGDTPSLMPILLQKQTIMAKVDLVFKDLGQFYVEIPSKMAHARTQVSCRAQFRVSQTNIRSEIRH